ncbi:MAG: glycosyltransferase [Chloroflexota bacterium]|nr:glycosyltransferase [Chloroflexota bacterium]
MTARVRTIHQFHPTLAYGDAVSNDCFELQRLFWDWGATSELYAWERKAAVQAFARDYREYGRPLVARPELGAPLEHGDLVADPERLLVVHLSMGNDSLDEVRTWPDRMIVRYHNISPPEFFEAHNEYAKRYAEKGREQLRAFAGVAPLALGDSEYNRRELEQAGFTRTAVVPILIDWSWTETRADRDVSARMARPGNKVLFVGRVSPQKAIHDLIAGFAAYRERDTTAQLVLVGSRDDAGTYGRSLEERVRSLGMEDAVVFAGAASDAELVAYYAGASAFATMSDHEGFCIPVLEAMRFDVPVVAHAAGATPETVGDAGILIERKSPEAIADALERALVDRASRDDLVARGRRRLEDYSRERVSAALRSALSAADIAAPTLRRHHIAVMSSDERCGIHDYSGALASGLAANGHRVSFVGVVRWDSADLARKTMELPREADVVLIEHEFGIFRSSALARAMWRMRRAGKRILLSLHELDPDKFHHYLKVLASIHYRQHSGPARELARIAWHSGVIAQRLFRYRATLWALGLFPERIVVHSARVLDKVDLITGDLSRVTEVPLVIMPLDDAPPLDEGEPDELRRALRTKLGLPQDRFIFISPGFLFRRKRLIEVIAAAPRDSLVVLSGTESAWDGDYLGDIRRFIAEQRLDNVVINTDYATMAEHVLAADAMVLFYRDVYQSAIATQAMWAEKPTIFSELSSFDLYRGAGLFASDERELAERMVEIQRPEVGERLVRQARVMKRLLSPQRAALRYLAGLGEV